jgi:hypothetical protein
MKIIFLCAARGKSYLLNLAREQKSLATPGIIDSTLCFTDLNELKLIKFDYGGFVLVSS